MKKILILLAFVLGLQNTEAQNNLPKWLSSTLKEGEAIGCGVDRETAMQDAIGQLYDRFSLSVDSTSLMAQLIQQDSTLVLDHRTVWVASAMNSSAFEVMDTLQEDSTYWAHLQVTADNLQKFVEQQRMTNLMRGSEYLIRAHICREQGNLVGASQEYVKGLETIRPCMHKALNSDLLEGKDLGVQLLNEYLTVFDGIELHALRDSLPIVCGEEIPVDLMFSLSVQGKPLVGFPVEGWIEDGKIVTSEQSDAKGMVKLHIVKAPQKSGMKTGIIVNRNLQSTLDDTYVKPLLLQHLDKGFPMVETRLVAFDPAPTFYIELDSIDKEHQDSLAVALTRRGMKEVSSREEADLICSLAYQGVRGESVKRGSYMLASTDCSMSVRIYVQSTGEELGMYTENSFRLSHPANKTDEDIRRRAVQLMMRRAYEVMPDAFAKVTYDKRKVVYDHVAKQ